MNFVIVQMFICVELISTHAFYGSFQCDPLIVSKNSLKNDDNSKFVVDNKILVTD